MGVDFADSASYILGSSFKSSLIKLFVVLSCGANIHIEDIGFAVFYLGFYLIGVLGRIHAAGSGAIALAFGVISGTNTFDKSNVFGFGAIGRTNDFSAGRTTCGN